MTRRLTITERIAVIAAVHAAVNDVLHAMLDALGIPDPDAGLPVPDDVIDTLIADLEEAL